MNLQHQQLCECSSLTLLAASVLLLYVIYIFYILQGSLVIERLVLNFKFVMTVSCHDFFHFVRIKGQMNTPNAPCYGNMHRA